VCVDLVAFVLCVRCVRVLCVAVCFFVSEYVVVCVCVCLCMFVCVCVLGCVWCRRRVRERACVFVCMFVCFVRLCTHHNGLIFFIIINTIDVWVSTLVCVCVCARVCL